jgi:hypothetical protein
LSGARTPRVFQLAVVARRRGTELTLDDLTSLLAERDVPRSSFPAWIALMEDLPKTEFGKHNEAIVKQLAADLDSTTGAKQ